MVIGAQMMNLVRPLMGGSWVQALLKNLAGKYVKGADEKAREKLPTYVWGEARNAAGDVKTVRIKTANGYKLTVDGALVIAAWLMNNQQSGGSYTPAMLLGADLVEKLPGSGKFKVE